MAPESDIPDEALAWAVKTSDPEFSQWEAFTAWLEASPANGRAYDRIMHAVENGAVLLSPQEVTATPRPASRTASRWFAPSLAASLAIVAGLWVWHDGSESQSYRTDPGETREIRLADGSAVMLAGASHLVLDDDEPRFAHLKAGRAFFEVRHDERRPFRVEVADATLVDAGTAFDVSIRGSKVSVGVSEGAVVFNPDSENALVTPGKLLTFAKGGGYRIEQLPIELVGEWRAGRLTFRNAPLAEVIGDIARATGVAYRVEGGGGQLISGSLAIDAVRDNPKSLGVLLGVDVRREGAAWVIAP